MNEETESEANTPPSLQPHRGTLILVLGILTLVLGCFPLGIVAFVMGKSDMEKMDRGIMDPEGRNHTSIGKILGIVGFFVSLIVTIVTALLLVAAVPVFLRASGATLFPV